MIVRVIAEKCQGHNRCYALAPELFDVDDLGYATRSATARSLRNRGQRTTRGGQLSGDTRSS